jgi:hypothetical protein
MHIILDIDNTLLESIDMRDAWWSIKKQPDCKLELKNCVLHVYFRPFMRYFMECLRSSNEFIDSVSFFSTGTREYCEAVIDKIIPKKSRSRTFPYRILARENCDIVNYDKKKFLIKNLKTFWETNRLGADVNNTLIIDDSIIPHSSHPFNVLRVKPFFAQKDEGRLFIDTTLKDIYDYLVTYRIAGIRFDIPPCKCSYTRLINQTYQDLEIVCYTCMDNGIQNNHPLYQKIESIREHLVKRRIR